MNLDQTATAQPTQTLRFGDRDPRRPDTYFFTHYDKKTGVPQWRSDASHARQLERAKEWRIKNAGDRAGLAQTLYNSASGHSDDRGVEFALTVEQIESLIPEDMTCPVLGHKFVYGRGRFGATLDRILNDRGYVWGNVRVICRAANSAKNQCSDPSQLANAKTCQRGMTRDDQLAVAAYMSREGAIAREFFAQSTAA